MHARIYSDALVLWQSDSNSSAAEIGVVLGLEGPGCRLQSKLLLQDRWPAAVQNNHIWNVIVLHCFVFEIIWNINYCILYLLECVLWSAFVTGRRVTSTAAATSPIWIERNSRTKKGPNSHFPSKSTFKKGARVAWNESNYNNMIVFRRQSEQRDGSQSSWSRWSILLARWKLTKRCSCVWSKRSRRPKSGAKGVWCCIQGMRKRRGVKEGHGQSAAVRLSDGITNTLRCYGSQVESSANTTGPKS